MFDLQDLARAVFASLIKKADAKRNLISYLELHFRSELIEQINIKNILTYVVNKVGEGVDKAIFLEDLVDEFIKENRGDDLEPLVVSKAKKKFKIPSETAHDIVGTKKSLNEVNRSLLKEIVKEYTPFISKYLLTFFNNKYMEWVRKKEQEPRITEDMPEPSVPPEHEMEEEMKKKQEWQEGLIKDILDLINTKVPEERRPVYKLILKDMFLARKPKTLEELEKQINKDHVTIHRYQKDLTRILKEFLEAQGLGGGYLEEGGLARKEIVYPDYQEFLKDTENSKEFKGFIDDRGKGKRGPAVSSDVLNIIKLFAEGKDISEISSEKYSKNTIQKIKNQYFIPWYKEWYAEKVKDIREACEYNAFVGVIRGIMARIAKRVVIPYERVDKKEEEGEGEAVASSHETMVNNAINKHQVVATVFFTANYDNLDVIAGRKDPKKDPIDFKYIAYEASLSAERVFFKTTRTVEYTYNQDLKEGGTFVEKRGESSLVLDGKKVSSSNDLKKELDLYVEHHMKPEGMLPYGRAMSKKTKNILFPVQYINKKNGNKYPGVRNFFEKFRGLLVEDPIHHERKKYIEEKEKGRTLPISETKKVKEILYDLKDTLEEEKKKKDKDFEAIRHLGEEIKKMEELLKGGDLEKDIEDIIKQETEFLKDLEKDIRTAAVFPLSESEKVKRLLISFDNHKITRPNPYGWLEPVELLALAKALKVHIKIDLERDLKELKKQKGLKKVEKDSKAHELETKAREEIYDTKEYFKDFPDDLRKRRDIYKSKHREDYDLINKAKNLIWVDNKDEVNRILNKINKDLSEEMKIEKPREKQIMRVIEKSKYKSLESFLEQELTGISIIAERLKDASLTEEGMSPDTRSRVEGALEKSQEGLKETRKELGKLIETGLETDSIKELRSKIPEYLQTIKTMRERLQRSQEIPALILTQVLLDHVTNFSSLYSFLSSILWFGEYALVTKAEDLTEEESHDLNSLKKKVIDTATMIANYNIYSKDQIKSGLSKLKTLLKNFGKLLGEKIKSEVPKLHGLKRLKEEEKEEKSRFPKQLLKPRVPSFPEPEKKSMSAAEDYERARIKAIFPADELGAADKMIEELKSEKRTESHAGIAQKELDKIVSNVSTAYKEGLDRDTIQALADKEKIPYNDAAVRLKKIQDSLSKHALSMFILRWKKIKEKGKKKERSPLGNRPDTEYQTMMDFVERYLSDLAKLAPPSDEIPQEPSRGIPTPKEIRESIEKMFTSKGLPKWVTEREKTLFPKDVEELKEEKDPFGRAYIESIEGLGEGSSKGPKTRPKVVKAPVPKITAEILKDRVVQMFDKPAEYIVLSTMAFYVKKIKDIIKATKEEEYIDIGDVIDGLISFLKQLHFLIVHLIVEPSAREWKLPPEGTPKSSGRPDIVINNSEEAIKVFNKIIEIYKIINHYIAPDKIGIPPKNISDLRSKSQLMKRHLPVGLVDWYPIFQKEEGKKKEAYNLPMAYRIVSRFANTGNALVDNYNDKDLIFID